MKSKIKYINRTEQQVDLAFERDEKVIKNIEKTFQKLMSGFKLSNYEKKYSDKLLYNFWESDKKKEYFNFTLVARKDFVKLKIKGKLNFMNKFLKILKKYTEFSELSPKIKAKLQRKKFKLF